MEQIKKASISLIIIALIFNAFPFKLFAQNGSYINLSNSVYTESNVDYIKYDLSSLDSSFEYVYIRAPYSSNENYPNVRATSFICPNGLVFLIGTENNPFPSATYGYFYKINGSSTNSNTSLKTYSINNNSYQFRYFLVSGTFNSSYSGVTTTTGFYSIQASELYNILYQNAVDPSYYGDLQDVGFYTMFTNSQQSNISQMALNKDVITWDSYQDTMGNDLNNVNFRVDIQAASVDYSANSKSDLLNQTINNMLTGDWSDLITISPNVGQYSFTWETVARALFGSNYTANWWNNLFNVFDSAQGVFYKKGWIYRIRLRTADNSYIGNWQIIYNVTSAPPSDSEKVYTNYYIYNYQIPDEETYQVINNINTINNTNNNWYQNDVPFNPDSGSDWLEKLIEFISELIQKILDFFSNIFDGLVDLILGLFDNVNPAESFFNWFSNLFNGIGDIDLTLPQFNIPDEDLSSFNRLVQETLDIFSFNNFGFVIFIPLLLIIIKAVF